MSRSWWNNSRHFDSLTHNSRHFERSEEPFHLAFAVACLRFLRAHKPLRRLTSSLLVCLLAAVMLGVGPTDPTARFGRLGHKMMCVCGCGQVLIECNHVGCPDSTRMLAELNAKVAEPDADAQILNWFVAKYGATVLAAPIRGGFDNVAWFIPVACFVCGIFGTAFLVRHFTHRRQALAAPAPLPLNDAIRERIRRETETQ